MNEVLDRLPAAFIAFGDDGKLSGVNRPLCAMVGAPAEELLGKHVETLLTVPSRIFYQTHVFPLLKMQGHIEEVYLTAWSRSGEEVPIMINGARYEAADGPLNECLLFPMRKRDDYENQIIEARKQAERATQEKELINESLLMTQAALKRQQQKLEDRNCELETLRETLQEEVEKRTAELVLKVQDLQGFNYSIAHDLRAPLRAILATSSILLSEMPEAISPEHRNHLDRQIHNAKKLNSLVDGLLSFSRLGLASITSRQIDMSLLAAACARAASANHHRPNVRFEIEPGIEASGDREMIGVVLENLFDNAVKYSPLGGEVAFGAITRGTQTLLYVRDQGIGIPEEYVHKIFLPFERLHRDDQFPGTGIGLANVKRILQRHGGDIWVEPTPGGGSTFLFFF